MGEKIISVNGVIPTLGGKAIVSAAGGGGSGVEVIADITLTEEADHIYVTADTSGNPFVLDYAEFDVSIIPTSSNASEAALSMRTNANTAAKGGTFSDFIRMFRSSGAKQFCGGRLYANQCIFGELNTTQGGSVHNYNNIDWNTITAFYFYGGVFGVGSRIVVKGRRV